MYFNVLRSITTYRVIAHLLACLVASSLKCLVAQTFNRLFLCLSMACLRRFAHSAGPGSKADKFWLICLGLLIAVFFVVAWELYGFHLAGSCGPLACMIAAPQTSSGVSWCASGLVKGTCADAWCANLMWYVNIWWTGSKHALPWHQELHEHECVRWSTYHANSESFSKPI